MVLTMDKFNALLQALSLTQGMIKPEPSAPASPHELSVPPGGGGPLSLNNDVQTEAATSAGPLFRLPGKASNCAGQWYDAPPVDFPEFPPFDQYKATVYRYRQQQSVNLGSWFVHEKWMTPSIFACAAGDQISEIDIASGWGSPDSARAALERHWDTFITEADFKYLASIGINTVRLPIGYWSLGPDYCSGTVFEPVADVYRNSWPRVARAINWAENAGIGVLVDLHGAPGSQNGEQHSGVSDGQTGLFGDSWNIDKTTEILKSLMLNLVNVTNVVGIQLLNEPKNVDSLADFYSNAITTMRAMSPASATFPLYIHDGFDLDRFSTYVAQRSDFVVQDHHSYFVFTPQDASKPAYKHTNDVRTSISGSLYDASERQRRNLVVDEFSCALTDQSLAGEDDPAQARRDFCQGQIDMYGNTTAGWAFWAYDKEQCEDDPGWCFKAAVGKSLPSTFFSYGSQPPADLARLPLFADIVGMVTPPTSYNDTRAVDAFSAFSEPMNAYNSSRRDYPPDEQPTSDPATQGYADGYLTAKIFAFYQLSKLGFTGQYINDSIALLGSDVIAPGMEESYARSFMDGLKDGEAAVSSYVQQGPT